MTTLGVRCLHRTTDGGEQLQPELVPPQQAATYPQVQENEEMEEQERREEVGKSEEGVKKSRFEHKLRPH